jgi:hypothetical protein
MQRYLIAFLSITTLLVWTRAEDKAQVVHDCFVGANDLLDKSAPTFEQFAVKANPPSTPAKLDLESNPIARTYRTVLRNGMRQGANFAGHYRVVVWGCGASCAQFAVVNLANGRVITANGIEGISGVHFSANGFLPHTDSEYWGFRFMKDSRLLVLVGAVNEDESNEGAFYYVLGNEQLRLLHKTPASRSTCKDEKE